MSGVPYIASGVIESIAQVARASWWIFLPVIAFFALWRVYWIYVHDKFVKNMQWVLLEIKIPKDILRTPKAMEQVFAAMYADYSHGLTLLQHYIDGYVDSWYSFEIVGDAYGIHFYIFTQTKRRNVVESAIYAQYPDAEIHEVEDYTEALPRVLPNKNYNLWGTDLILGRESCYPIRTYPYFEETQEEKRLDPISTIAEVMSGLKGEQRIWYQIIVSPSDFSIGNNWKSQGEAIMDKITGKKKEASRGFFGDVAEFVRNFVWAPIEHPIWGETKKPDAAMLKFLNPSEQEVIKAIDTTISKLGFEVTFRFIYIDRADTFSSTNATAVMGSIRQFNTQNLNFWKPGKELTLLKGWKPRAIPYYAKWDLFSMKKKVYSNYKVRKLNGTSTMIGKYRGSRSLDKVTTLNTEELATLYHFPTMMVEAPKLRRAESRRGGAPADLPIVEAE